MLQRAIAESAAEARGAICEAEKVDTAPETQLLQADGSLLIEQIDSKLWAGAAEQGWVVRPLSVRRYLRGNYHSYLYVAPTGERYTNRRNAARSSSATACGVTQAAASDGVEFVTAMSDSDDDDAVEAPLAVVECGVASLHQGSGTASDNPSAADSTLHAARARHEAAAAAALAACERSDDGFVDSDDEDSGERCMIWGCKRRLLRCFGVKADVGDALGCAESAHVLCATCLTRWWEAEKALRAQSGLSAPVRKVCPCCKIEIRNTGETRRAGHLYHLGLLKVTSTWEG